jgi:hypothetical protein
MLTGLAENWPWRAYAGAFQRQTAKNYGPCGHVVILVINFLSEYTEENFMSELLELQILKDFTDILESLEITYVISGSVASSIYGKVRFTQDADMTVEPFEDKADKFFTLVGSDFYISSDAMKQALRQRSSFNVVHLESAFKIDVFIQKDTEFEKQLFSRRQFMKLSEKLEKTFSVVTAEDIILLKLRWYEQTGCSSQKQWEDILAVLEVQKDMLDFGYLQKWSGILKINQLLTEAISKSES